MPKPVIISGIQPSGRLHIGNYLGAMKNFLALQNEGKYQCLFFIADLHSLTETYASSEKAAQIQDLAISYLAAGLNPKKSTLFIQSHVPAHTELGWIFNTITPMGELERMTQYKDKAERAGNNVGLFAYPVLMAADILLYDSAAVPVGNDQDQHLELTRTIARKFNSRFGQTFVEPKSVITSTPRVMSLDDPMKKMSKSRPAGCLFIDDEPEVIKKKIMSAVTDSGKEVLFSPEAKPGIANLLMITEAITGKPIAELEQMFAGKNYGEFKSFVAEAVANYFAPFRAAKAKLMKNPKKALAEFTKGAKKATALATKKMKEVKKKVGLI